MDANYLFTRFNVSSSVRDYNGVDSESRNCLVCNTSKDLRKFVIPCVKLQALHRNTILKIPRNAHETHYAATSLGFYHTPESGDIQGFTVNLDMDGHSTPWDFSLETDG